MLKAIVATDLSEASGLAASAICEAEPGAFAQVTIVHVVDLDPYTAGGSIPGIMEFAEERLAEEARYVRDCGIATDTVVTQGDTVETLERLAAEHEADLIVATSLGKGALLGRALGSTVERLVSKGALPVLVERVCVTESGACVLAAEETTFSRVLVAAGLDGATPLLLETVAGLPGTEEVRVVHVASEDADTRRLETELKAALSDAALPEGTETTVVSGDPGDVLMGLAEEWGATLIAIASCRHGLVHRMVWGSVARKVARDAGCSVLLVPAAKAAAS